MKIRLAKKIMAYDVRKKTEEELLAMVKHKNWYWLLRFSKYREPYLNDPVHILICDHRITKAISLTSKKKKHESI